MAIKKYPKLVQCDSRGQIVIPKDIRRELKIDEGTGFWIYTITDEGILLRKVDVPELDRNSQMIREISEKADRLKMKKKSIDSSVDNYRKTRDGGLDVI